MTASAATKLPITEINTCGSISLVTEVPCMNVMNSDDASASEVIVEERLPESATTISAERQSGSAKMLNSIEVVTLAMYVSANVAKHTMVLRTG